MKRTGPSTSHVNVIILSLALICTLAAPAIAAHGGLDNTFDGNGRLATDFDAGLDTATDIALLSNGKIVVVGTSIQTVGLGQAAIARYNPDGSLDTTFSGDGKLLLTANCSDVKVAISSGRIVVAYYIYTEGSPAQLRVTRLNGDGTPDTSFDTDGTAIDAAPENFVLGGIAVEPSTGKIIVVGGSSGSVGGGTPISDWLLWRFNTSGSLDTGFSGDGRQQTDFGGNTNEFAGGVAALSNGAIIVGGTGNPTGQVFAAARYTTNGSLDTNWGGGDGKILSDISPSSDVVNDVEVFSDGRFILAGRSLPGGIPTATVASYKADGTPDTSFDGDGILQSAAIGTTVEGIDVTFDGKLITIGGAPDYVIGRFNVNGTPDTLFGVNGVVTSDMNNGSNDNGRAVIIQPDRKIVAAGSCLNTAAGSNRNFCVARYLPTNLPYKAPFDFDGDGKSDYGVFRPSNASWWIDRSDSNGTYIYGFGVGTDRIASADFTGDGKTDTAVFRPSNGQWYVLRSENFSFYAFPFGADGDVPVPADYDADGKADPAVYRPSTSIWYISQSGGAPTQIVQFGINGDQPVVADYDEDGKADVGIFRPGPREWWIARSTAGILAMQFGATGDKPVQGDYTGDGKADVAIFRPTTGEWFVVRSEDFSFFGFPFGTLNDIPAPADYDGDGRIDPTVVRGVRWFIGMTSGETSIFNYGTIGDKPIPNAFVP